MRGIKLLAASSGFPAKEESPGFTCSNVSCNTLGPPAIQEEEEEEDEDEEEEEEEEEVDEEEERKKGGLMTKSWESRILQRFH